MTLGKRARRSIVFATWFSVLFMLLGTISWVPTVAAQDATPDDSSSENEPGGVTTTLELLGQDESATETQEDQSAPLQIDAVSLSCLTNTGTILGTLRVSNPQEGQVVDLKTVIDGVVVRSIEETMSPALSSVQFTIALQAGDTSGESSLEVTAVEKDSGNTPAYSNTLTIHLNDRGQVVCGPAPAPDPTETPTPEPTPTQDPNPTETATSTPSETPTSTPSPTPTSTPTTPTPEPPESGSATVVNTGGAGLRCRTAPSNGSIILVAPEGSTVETRGATQDGWVPVVCGGEDGWMSAAYLSVQSGGDPSDPGDATYATVVNTGGAGLRCRTAPVSGATIMVIPEGQRVPVRGDTQDGWVPVTCGGQNGWSSATYLSLGSTPAPDPGDEPDEGTGVYGVVVNTGYDSLRCRTAPVNGATITLLPPNTRVETRGDAQNGWVPVICAGEDGWVSNAYFAIEGEDGTTTPPPSTGSGEMVTITGTGGSGLRCRTAPVDGAILGVIPEGARVEARGDLQNGWLPVKCFEGNGWVSSAYVLFDADSGGGEFWIDINLSTQYMRVFRGNTVLMETYVSTGRPGFDTPPGTFYIIRKIPVQTMSGVLGGEYYNVPDVPWVMYFTDRGHAIHGAYWHNNFGHVMSHGCVNLPVATAEWLYANTPMYTRVNIHY